jgi:hypothetical protein
VWISVLSNLFAAVNQTEYATAQCDALGATAGRSKRFSEVIELYVT